jgi:hypothetical protein
MSDGTAPRLVAFALLGVLAVVGAGLVWLGWAATRPGTRNGAFRRGRAAPGWAAGSAAALVAIGLLLVFGAAAVVLRRGPALRLTLRDGKTFLVTVDDAATGAALLNDLITQAM